MSINKYPAASQNEASAELKKPAGDAVSGRVHAGNVGFLRLIKAGLREAILAGEALQAEQQERGRDFETWVKQHLLLAPGGVAFYLACFERLGRFKEKLSPAVETKPSVLFELLAVVEEIFRNQASEQEGAETTSPADCKRAGKMTKGTASKPARAASPATDQDRKKAKPKQRRATTKTTSKQLAEQTAGGESELTPQQQKLLLRSSPKLLLRVHMGELTAKEALRLADSAPGNP